MALRIVNNIAALNTQRWLSVSDAGMKKSLERLSSGYRINRAADDAAGLAISQSFRADIASFKVASRNASEASSLLQVGEGAMDQIGNMLTRLKELATQAASANAGTELGKIDAEKAELILEIDRISGVTEYAGTKLIDGTFGTLTPTWGSSLVDTTYDIDTTNGLNYKYTDTNTNNATVSFTFNSPVALAADTYTLATSGGTAVKMTGALGEVFEGTLAAGGLTLSFATIGLTLTGASAMTTTAFGTDTIIVTDAGYSSMTLSSSTATGTWTATSATANSITLTNTRTSDVQTVLTVDGSAQTLDFDTLGIKLTLDSAYADNEFDSFAFDVASSGSSTFQVGSSNTANDRVNISLGDATASGLGISALDLATAAGAQSALTTIDSAISALATVRGNIGAAQNRLGYAAANLATTIENVQAAESIIRDVDMASEMTDFTKNQILLQAGTAMLAQANMAPQQVLALFG
ncbi:MAG TPA: flagellin [Anaerolineae bacterium]|nr:flagellin [Anaerolineae bacterium]